MITVVHLITRLELGGAQENTLSTCAGLDPARFRVALWYGPGGLLDADARALAHVAQRTFPSLLREIAPGPDLRALNDVRRALLEARAEHARLGHAPHAFIVHTHSSKAGILGRLAARAAGVPWVVHGIHGFGFHEGQNPLRYQLFLQAERAAGRLTDAFVSVSHASLAEARAKGIVRPGQRAEVVRSGFDLAAFRREVAEGPRLRAELGFGPADEVIVSIANLKPQKDPSTLVAAMAKLAARRPRATLLYAGDGELRPRIEAEIAAAGLGDRFRLLGWRRDVGALMGAADVVVLASIFEGLPRSAVQAIVARRPCVATRVDGTPEIVHDGRNGFLVPARDPESLADALERALRDRPVDPADEAYVLDWDVERMVGAQARLYEALVAQ